MVKNRDLREIYQTVFISFVLLGILIMVPGIEMANAADTDELKATDLERIKPGTEALDFNLESVEKNWVRLSGYKNQKKVILVFYRGYW